MTIGSTITSVLNTQNKVASTTWSPTTAADIPSGNYAFIAVAIDNLSAGGGNTNDITSVSVGGQAFTKIAEYSNAGAAASAATVAVFGKAITSTITAGATVDIAFSGSVTAKGAIGGYFTFNTAKPVGIAGPSFSELDASTPTFSTVSPAATSAAMCIGVCATEANTQSITSATFGSVIPNNTAFTTGGGSAANIGAGGLYDYSSDGSWRSFLVNVAASSDFASIAFQVYEITIAAFPPIHPGRQYLPHIVR